MRLSKAVTALVFGALILLLAPTGTSVLAKRGVRLVCDIWPPYQMDTKAGYSGLSVDVVRAVYARLGVEDVEIMALPWKRAMEMVRYGDADGLFSANRTPEREAYLYYPEEPLFESAWEIWTRHGTEVRSLEDLRGMTVGVVLGYSYTPEFWDFIRAHCTVEEVATDDVNFRKLAEGRIDAVAAEYGNGLTLATPLHADLHANPGLKIKEDGLFIVFSRDHTTEDAVRTFSDELKAFKKTEAYLILHEKYLGAGP